MKQNNKPLGRLRLALLVLCAFILSLTAVITAGLFGAKNSDTASAFTASSTVYGGEDIYNSTDKKFLSDGVKDLCTKLYGTTTPLLMKKYGREMGDTQVKIAGKNWTPVYADHTDGNAYVVLMLTTTSGSIKTGTTAGSMGSMLAYMQTGLGYQGLANTLSPYIMTNTTHNLPEHIGYEGLAFWIPSALCFDNYAVNSSTFTTTITKGAGIFGMSNNQISASSIYWIKPYSYPNFYNTKTDTWWTYIAGGDDGTTSNIPSSEWSSMAPFASYGLRPCFVLNLSLAYASSYQETPVVNPKVTYTGNLYTSSKMPTISLSTGDTAGSIAWTDTSLTAGTKDYSWKFTPSSSAYKEVTGSYRLTVEDVKFNRVSATFDSGADIVYTNTEFDALKSYIQVKGYNNDGTLIDLYTDGIIPADKYTLLGELTPGTNTLKVLCEDADVVGEVTITNVQSAGDISYDSLEVAVLPTVTAYKAYEKLNTTGMKVNAVYTNGSRKEVTDYTVTYADYDGDPSDCLHYGDTAVTLSYTIDGVEHTSTVAVTVDYADSTVTPVVDIQGTLYTSSDMPSVDLSDGDTAGTIVWKKVENANGDLVDPKLLAGENEYEWIFTPSDGNFKPLEGKVKIAVEEVALASISATYTAPVDPSTGETKKVYTSTKLNDILGVTVKGVNNDGSLFTQFDPDGKIPATEYKLAGTLVEGTSEITVTYQGKVFILEIENVLPVELEELKAEYERDTIIYASYTVDKLKEGLTVTAVYSDGTEKVLTYYSLTNNLTENTPVITIEYEGVTLNFEPLARNLKIAQISGIEVKFSPTGVIYTTATFAELKKYVTVTVLYNDDSKQENLTVEELEASLGGSFGLVAGVSGLNLSAGNGNAVAVAYTPADGSGAKYATFTVNNVLSVELKGIQVEVNVPDGVTVTTATSLDVIKSYLKVSATYNVGDPVVIGDPQRISVIGTLKSPASTLAVVYEDVALGVKVSKDIVLNGVEQAKSKPKVTPQITVSGALVEGKALPQISLSLGDTTGSIAWKEVSDGQGGTCAPTLKAGTNMYYWVFTPADTDLYEELTASDCVYYLTAEAVKPTKLTIQRNESAGIIYDNIDNEELKTKFKVVVSYNDGREDTELAPENYEISAVLKAGVSSVLFSYVDEKGNAVTATAQVSVLSGEIKFVDLLWTGGREFEFNGKAQTPTAYFLSNGEMIMYGKDNIKIYKMGANGEYEEEVTEAVYAGSYKLVAENADKYTVRSGGDYTFKINPKTITRPTAIATTGYVYNGSVQEFLLDGFDETKMQVVGNKQSEVGKHMVTVKITDSNYTFAVGNGTADELNFEFNIQTASTPVVENPATPVVTVEGNGISTPLAIAIAVAVILVLVISVVAIIIALKNKGSSDSDGFYDTVG
ncbi:MAG: hypothetical protein HDQ88_02450 [Clostridia bacterium]|nr:hypothetical protein [Clostridia bacterium]